MGHPVPNKRIRDLLEFYFQADGDIDKENEDA
jgi:hypothetical protein